MSVESEDIVQTGMEMSQREVWVSDHQGIESNKTADELAREREMERGRKFEINQIYFRSV